MDFFWSGFGFISVFGMSKVLAYEVMLTREVRKLTS